MSSPNCGSATRGRGAIPIRKPELTLDGDVAVAQSELWELQVCIETAIAPWLFTENETNGRRFSDCRTRRVTSKMPSTSSSSIGNQRHQSRSERGTKTAAHYHLEVPAGGRAVVRLRLSRTRTPTRLPASTSIDRRTPSGGRRLLRPPADRTCPTISGSSSGRRWPG